MTNQINEIINNLADKFGIAVTEIYGVMESQAKVEIVKSVFSAAVCLVVLYLCWLYARNVLIEKNENGDSIISKADDDCGFAIVAHVFLFIGVAVLSIIMVILVIGYFRTVVQCLLNPRYWALKELFGMVTDT